MRLNVASDGAAVVNRFLVRPGAFGNTLEQAVTVHVVTNSW